MGTGFMCTVEALIREDVKKATILPLSLKVEKYHVLEFLGIRSPWQ